MTEDIITRLNEACIGHPHARIAWPHRLLHDAIKEIETLRAVAETDAVAPTDMVLVPREPTEEMKEAFARALCRRTWERDFQDDALEKYIDANWHLHRSGATLAYKAMLSSSPSMRGSEETPLAKGDRG